MTRIEICNSCTFYKGKCTFCGCSGKGIIDDPESRCPRNLWPDGWGVAQLIVDPWEEPIETDYLIDDDELNIHMYYSELISQIEKYSDTSYVFESKEEFMRYIVLKDFLYNLELNKS